MSLTSQLKFSEENLRECDKSHGWMSSLGNMQSKEDARRKNLRGELQRQKDDAPREPVEHWIIQLYCSLNSFLLKFSSVLVERHYFTFSSELTQLLILTNFSLSVQCTKSKRYEAISLWVVENNRADWFWFLAVIQLFWKPWISCSKRNGDGKRWNKRKSNDSQEKEISE